MIIYGLQMVKSFKVTFALNVTFTIYLFYNLCRFAIELIINILTMIILSSFMVTCTIYLFYNLCRCILVLSYTRYKHINNDPSRWPSLYIYFTFSVDFPLLYWLELSTSIWLMIHPLSRWSLLCILQSLHSCTRYTEYRDICNNLLVSTGIINHTEEEYYICVLKGVLLIILKKSTTSVYSREYY